MTNTAKRFITGIVMFAILAIIVELEKYGFHATRWAAVIVALGMIIEMVLAIKRAPSELIKKDNNRVVFYPIHL